LIKVGDGDSEDNGQEAIEIADPNLLETGLWSIEDPLPGLVATTINSCPIHQFNKLLVVICGIQVEINSA